ncbi:right-handed parallel beta-helix repeat-containing protein [bacterium]|nr:right-handed parallel beta-helix repeat-containing protein [bacterium]
MMSLILCLGLLIQVPQDYPTITEAIDISSQGDTIWVHPDTYPEQLWLPSHDILLVSDFFFTGDSSALYNTIIDASAWAEEDTASAVMVVRRSTRETIFSGFTVTGGHGTRRGGSDRHGGAFYIFYSSPTISSNIIRGNYAEYDMALSADSSDLIFSGNIIYDNWGYILALGLGSGGHDTPAIIEGNNFGRNNFIDPDWGLYCPALGFSYSDVIIRFNHFHDYEGCIALGASFVRSKAEVSSNVFENLHYRHCEGMTPYSKGSVLWIDHSNVDVVNNEFRNCSVFDIGCVYFNESPYYSGDIAINGNVFENIYSSPPYDLPPSGCGLLLLNSDGVVSHNRFTNCSDGAIGISIWTQFPPCSVFVTENTFDSNDYDDYWVQHGVHIGSAIGIGTDGTAECILRGNTFIDNQKNAVDILYASSDSTSYLDAENNFWGDSSGPYHPTLNPTGRGDTIAGRVDFDPWLIENDIDSDNRPSTPVPQDFTLLEPYPNPFNPGVTLPLSVTCPGIFNVVIFDLLGRRIWEQTEQLSGAGIHRIYWPGIDSNGQTVTTGIYFARASSASQITPARKLILLK